VKRLAAALLDLVACIALAVVADLVERLRSWKQVRTTPYPIGYYLDAGIKAADEIERLQSLLEAANAYGAGENKARVEDRELLAQMMIRQSLSTGHGDTVADLVRELEPQIERLRAECLRLSHAEAEAMSVVLSLEGQVERLRAEVAALKRALGTDWDGKSTLRMLTAERDALKKDAERYRWLRDVGDANWLPIAKRGITAKECDAAIDAALGGEKS